MQLAASNLMFPAFDHAEFLPRVAELGIKGVEVAPYHTFPELTSGAALTQAVSEYWAAAFSAGLRITGLRGLTEQPLDVEELAFGATRRRHMEELLLLSAVCRDLGGSTLSLGARRRGSLLESSAQELLREFLEELIPKLEAHGTVLCLSPLLPEEGDVLVTANDCNNLSLYFDHPALGVELGTDVLTRGGDGLPMGEGRVGHTIFALCEHQLYLFRLDEPERAVIGSSNTIDHIDFRLHLQASRYEGWMPILQDAPNGRDPIAALKQARDFVQGAYFPAGDDREQERKRRC